MSPSTYFKPLWAQIINAMTMIESTYGVVAKPRAADSDHRSRVQNAAIRFGRLGRFYCGSFIRTILAQWWRIIVTGARLPARTATGREMPCDPLKRSLRRYRARTVSARQALRDINTVADALKRRPQVEILLLRFIFLSTKHIMTENRK